MNTHFAVRVAVVNIDVVYFLPSLHIHQLRFPLPQTEDILFENLHLFFGLFFSFSVKGIIKLSVTQVAKAWMRLYLNSSLPDHSLVVCQDLLPALGQLTSSLGVLFPYQVCLVTPHLDSSHSTKLRLRIITPSFLISLHPLVSYILFYRCIPPILSPPLCIYSSYPWRLKFCLLILYAVYPKY